MADQRVHFIRFFRQTINETSLQLPLDNVPHKLCWTNKTAPHLICMEILFNGQYWWVLIFGASVYFCGLLAGSSTTMPLTETKSLRFWSLLRYGECKRQVSHHIGWLVENISKINSVSLRLFLLVHKVLIYKQNKSPCFFHGVASKLKFSLVC